jgi:prepilin-type N-terminal cleavage/methylation domain-containing protein
LNNQHALGKGGFTLLELILVIFLIGLMAGIVLPFVVSTLDRVKLQSEARQISSALQLRIKDYQGAEETVSDGTFIINFYPRGNSSAGTIHLQSSIAESDALVYAITIDPITGKPKIKLLEE